MAYSLDLRQRIVDAVERGIDTKRNIAKLYDVHESFIYKLMRQKRERGDIAPLPHGGGAKAKLTEDRLTVLYDLVAATPDAQLKELRQQLKKKTRVLVSESTICRGLQKLELTLKKKRSAPVKRTRQHARSSAKYRIFCPLNPWSF
jgi:putative transposase